jgi:uncharacterized protein (DUF362 family)
MTFLSRRQFITKSIYAGAALSALPHLQSIGQAQSPADELVVVKNGSAAQMVRKAVDALGGMAKFVKKNQTVLVKPNIGWDRVPEQAADTNPDVVAEVVKMCFEAGAKRVRVLDRTCNEARRCYLRSGIEKAAADAGAEVRYIVDSRFEEIQIPQGELLKSWPIYRDALESDVLINIPIAKHHGISRLTLGFKNLMGLLGGDRGQIHRDFMTKIVDIALAIKPDLTIIDAYRILLRNGPTGGNLSDVAETKTIIAGTDRVAVDAYAVSLFNMNLNEIEYIKIASQRGLGKMELSKVRMKEISMSS